MRAKRVKMRVRKREWERAHVGIKNIIFGFDTHL